MRLLITQRGYFIGCLILKVGCYAIPIRIFAFLCSELPRDSKGLNLAEHVFGITLAMRQKEQTHFWLSSANYENPACVSFSSNVNFLFH